MKVDDWTFCLAAFLALYLVASACTGCSSLPPGSYLEARSGYSKQDGATGKAVLHIPLR